jgi:S1-C subfamily serine protease
VKQFVLALLALTCFYSHGFNDLPALVTQHSIVLVVKGSKYFGHGSGWVWQSASKKKYIITNAHVCKSKLPLYSRRERTRVIKYDASKDLCALRTHTTAPPLSVGRIPLSPFEPVAIQGPEGFSLSTGLFIMYRLGKHLGVTNPAISSCKIRPGYSGSPVFNILSEVVGVTYSYGLADKAADFIPLHQLTEFLADLP